MAQKLRFTLFTLKVIIITSLYGLVYFAYHSKMRATVFIAVLINLIYLELSTTSNVFPSLRNGWLRQQSHDDNENDLVRQNDAVSLTYSNCLQLRGGASGDDDKKIKGICIGIDLGTTYRY